MTRNRAVLYFRCSTSGQNLDIQKHDLTRYADLRDFEVVDMIEDFAVSGAKDNRPGLNRLMLMARQRKFDYVLVWRLDRLGRNTTHLLTLIDEFQELQISLVSINEGFDLSTHIGKVMATLLAALSNFERSVLRERCAAGIENARRRGVVLGRPRKYVDVEGIINMREAGGTFSAIAKKYKISNGSIHTLLKNNTDLKKEA